MYQKKSKLIVYKIQGRKISEGKEDVCLVVFLSEEARKDIPYGEIDNNQKVFIIKWRVNDIESYSII